MRVFIVTVNSATNEGDESNVYLFTDYDKAYTAYKEFIANEMEPGNSWVGEIQWDEEGEPIDIERYHYSYDDNNSNESDVYWRIDDLSEPVCFVSIELVGHDIELPKCKLNTQDLWQLCNEKNWFTNGDNYQYERMFKANEEGCSLDELVAIIWICSNKSWTKEQIKDEIIIREIYGRNPL